MESYDVYSVQTGLVEGAAQGQLTLGYRTQTGAPVPDDLHSIIVEAADYAVLPITKNHAAELGHRWEQVALSNLPAASGPSVERWELNPAGDAVARIDLLIPLGPPTGDHPSTAEAVEPAEQAATVVAVETTPAAAGTTSKAQEEAAPPASDHEQESGPAAATLPSRQHEAFHVVGLQITVNYNNEAELEKALEALWDDFFKVDYSRHINTIVEPNNVYVSYTGYTENSVNITLGYRTTAPDDFKDGKGLKSASLAANRYFTTGLNHTEASYDRFAWERLMNAATHRTAASCDFEVYTFNAKYEVVETTLWVAAE